MKHILLILLCIAVFRTTIAMVTDTGNSLIVNTNNTFSFVENVTNVLQVRNELTVYPNPVSIEFFVRFDIGDKNNVSISLFDALGREVKVLERNTNTADGQILQFNLDQGLPNGRYFIKVDADGKQFVKSILVRH